ncbi:MAG: DUF2853 family protein [Hyphomonadaceae bacterium]|jgi:hypothetical protein|nr:DUF2853 family protein [Hyphomonadaceae bacterium]
MADASDYHADVKAYAGTCDEAAVAGLFKTYRLVLSKPDTRLVSASDPAELDRVRTNFLKKKLGLSDPDTVLDAAIAEVMATMKGDRTKNRLTVYYMLAERFGKLDLFKG